MFDCVRDLMRTNRSLFFEIARVLVRLDNVARFIVNVDGFFRLLESLAIAESTAGLPQIHSKF